MSLYGSAAPSQPLITTYRATFAVYVILGLIGCAGLVATLPIYDAVTIVAAVVASAAALAMVFGTCRLPSTYVFAWASGILLGGMGIPALVLLR